MLKEAMQYIVNLSAPSVQEINGETWSDKELYRIDYSPKAITIEMTTLTSLVSYIKSHFDEMSNMIIHVKSPTRAQMYSVLDKDRRRETMVEVNAQLPSFNFDRYIDHESFCIGLQSKFQPTNDRELLLKFAGTVESGTVAEYGDDGVTQKATVKTGIASKGEAIVPNPVIMKPYRTFLEVDQPESRFVFRMQDKGGVQCALFEADGGAWKMEAMLNIKTYLEKELEGLDGFLVIS